VVVGGAGLVLGRRGAWRGVHGPGRDGGAAGHGGCPHEDARQLHRRPGKAAGYTQEVRCPLGLAPLNSLIFYDLLISQNLENEKIRVAKKSFYMRLIFIT